MCRQRILLWAEGRGSAGCHRVLCLLPLWDLLGDTSCVFVSCRCNISDWAHAACRPDVSFLLTVLDASSHAAQHEQQFKHRDQNSILLLPPQHPWGVPFQAGALQMAATQGTHKSRCTLNKTNKSPTVQTTHRRGH